MSIDGGEFGFDGRNPYLLIATAEWSYSIITDQTKMQEMHLSLTQKADLLLLTTTLLPSCC